MFWISLISLLFLLLIVFSDFKTRQIPIICLIGETIASLCLGFNLIGMSLLRSTMTNFGIIGFQFLVLCVWFKTKRGKLDNTLWSKFGKGDLFMLAISAINFSALNYLLFTMLVSVTSIIAWLGVSFIHRNKDQTIPFAGFLALGLIILRIFLLSEPGTNYYSDQFHLNHIYGIY